MTELTAQEKDEIIRRRGSKCESIALIPHRGKLVVHHVDRDPDNNDPSNLKVYCEGHHPPPRR